MLGSLHFSRGALLKILKKESNILSCNLENHLESYFQVSPSLLPMFPNEIEIFKYQELETS